MAKKKAPEVPEQVETAIRVRKSKEIRLHDTERPYLPIVFLRDFGFKPDAIIIEKVAGVSNKFIIGAVLTKEEIEKEDKALEAIKNKTEAKSNDEVVVTSGQKPSEGIVQTQLDTKLESK